MEKSIYILLLFFGVLNSSQSLKAQQNFRPPAYPLVTVDPYFSIWSFQDTLYNGPTRHWTSNAQPLQGIIRVDDKSKYFLGQPLITYDTILPMTQKKGKWQYTFSNPGRGWRKNYKNKDSWQITHGAFGDGNNTANSWNGHNIWARRIFTIDDLKSLSLDNLKLKIHHDDNVEVYINGALAYKKNGWVNKPVKVDISDQAKKLLKKGSNILAIHCINTGGGAYLDAGLVEKKKPRVSAGIVNQISSKISATQTIYRFKSGQVAIEVIFTAPLLPKNLDLISWPANYVTFKVHSMDGKSHNVQLYFSASSNISVNSNDQSVVWQRMPSDGLDIMRVGTANQQILGRKGDNVRIDWGYLYMSIPTEKGTYTRIATSKRSTKEFMKQGKIDAKDTRNMPQAPESSPVTLAVSFDFGKVGNTIKQRHATLAYDELYSIEYFNHPLQSWWKRDGKSVVGMLNQSEDDYKQRISNAKTFDKRLYQKAKKAGGTKYAKLAELAYRQTIAAHALVESPEGKALFFSKENFSNGSIGTVDVTYPSAPLFLYYNPELLKGMLRPIFYYTESKKWAKPFPAHDVGTYPIANGQTYGGDMPLEEAGNMLILTAAISEVKENANFASKHWGALSTWAEYLLKKGMDPEKQLTTDDFAGRIAHNANLSIKAILGVASYGKMASMQGKEELAKFYLNKAKAMAKKWINLDKEGDHFKLAFDKPGTWSQKFNLVWDDVLNLNVFPDQVSKKEITYYLTKQNTYGLPLDSRHTYSVLEWDAFTAAMANDKSTFKKLIRPIYKYINNTPQRVPMSDFYQTTDASREGFQARSVVGSIFMKMLKQKIHSKENYK